MEDRDKQSIEEIENLYKDGDCQCGNFGMELLAEGASLFLEEPDKIADLLSPEELAEFDNICIEMRELIECEKNRPRSLKAADKQQ